MSLKLYGYWRSSATYRVRIAMHLKGLAFEYLPVHLVKQGGEQTSDDYKRLNPAMLVPTFIDDDEDVILNQSLAIIEYLDEKYDTECSLLPKHTLDKARIRALSYDIASDLQPINNLRVINQLKQDLNADEDYIVTWQQMWMNKAFEAMEQRLNTTAGEYCFGYDVSLADICLIPQVYNALRFKVDMSPYPLITKIYENCNKLEAFQKALPEKQVDAT